MSSTLPNPLSKKSPSKKSPSKKSVATLVVVSVLALFVAVSALPQYASGWAWSTPPKLPRDSRVALQAVPDQGIDLPGWKNVDQAGTKLGGNTWSIQQLSVDPSSADNSAQAALKDNIASVVLLLRPQVYGKDQPEVEWLDVKGSQRWKTDSHQKTSFDVSGDNSEFFPKNAKTVRISSDFFRAWSKEQTYAVLQWYAWPTGGSPSPARWFWADQKAQWQRHQRMPWVAVSLWLPIDPLGDIAARKTLAAALGQNLQQTLLKTVFQTSSTHPDSGSAVDES